MKKLIERMTKSQRDFLKNYERMTMAELEEELRTSKVGSIGWDYAQIEIQRRLESPPKEKCEHSWTGDSLYCLKCGESRVTTTKGDK